MAALVVGHDAKAGIGNQRREYVEGAREVERSVHQQHGRRVGGAPFVDGQAHTVGVDAALALGGAGARVVEEARVRRCMNRGRRNGRNGRGGRCGKLHVLCLWYGQLMMISRLPHAVTQSISASFSIDYLIWYGPKCLWYANGSSIAPDVLATTRRCLPVVVRAMRGRHGVALCHKCKYRPIHRIIELAPVECAVMDRRTST